MMQDAFYLLVACAFFALTAGLIRFAGRLEDAEQGAERS
jgi:hypothetical protein